VLGSRRPRLATLVAVGAACALAVARPARAQRRAELSAALDAGAAAVRYDGYLASGAVSMTPALQLDAPLASLTARGTYLVFQSGSQSVQGLVAASAFTPPAGLLRGEMSGTFGMSGYQRTDEPLQRYGHALGRGRVHLMRGDRGVYASGSLGRTTLADRSSRAVAAYGGGVWRRFARLSADLSTTATRVGDTSFVDTEFSARWGSGRWTVDGFAGARLLSEGGGDGVYGEAIGSYRITPQLALVASGGRYPTDPARGSIAGRYAALALRIARRLAPDAGGELSYLRPYRLPGARGTGAAVKRAAVELLPAPDGAAGARGVRLRLPGASSVELMGDFTDWQPTPLQSAGDDVWELRVALPPGSYRFNVRTDGGGWVVPPGVTALADDFGGIVALLVVR
jgi:hypothetical protein